MKFIILLLFGLYNFYLLFSWVPALLNNPMIFITLIVSFIIFLIVGISSLGNKNP